jgi:hypothetical protein
MLLCPLRLQDGQDMLVVAGQACAPASERSEAARQRARGAGTRARCRTGGGTARPAQGSRGQKVPQTLPSLGKPQRAGGQVGGCGHGQAWCGQRPQVPRLSHHCRGLPAARQPGSVF